MKTLVWNVRGMGSTCAFQVLLMIINTYNPDILFLVEMKINHVRMEFVRVKMGYSSRLLIVMEVRVACVFCGRIL